MEDSEKYVQSIQVSHKAIKEDAEILGCEIGTIIYTTPEPTNREDMFERLHKSHGQRVFESQKRIFSQNPINERTISDKLKELNEFIEDAESLSTSDTLCDPVRIHNIKKVILKRKPELMSSNGVINFEYIYKLIEYSRLKYGYYDSKELTYNYISFFGSNAALIYGKYFLFIDWLQSELNRLLGKEILPHPLQTNLTTDQRTALYKLLVDGKFIPDTTNPDCFNWAIGVTDENKPKQPGQWQPIQWNKSKQAFRELLIENEYVKIINGKRVKKTLIPILKTISNQNKRDIEKLFLDEFDYPLNKITAPKKNTYSANSSEICNIINQIQIEKKPHTPDPL